MTEAQTAAAATPKKRRRRPNIHPMIEAQIPLYPSEREIVALLFGAAAVDMQPQWFGFSQVLERSGLPPKDSIFGNRRYWPAVEAWLRDRNGLGDPKRPRGYRPNGRENWD